MIWSTVRIKKSKETALHIAAKNDRVETLKLLFGWLELTGKNKVLNWIDDEGNTVLHIASRRNQIEVVRLLIGLVTYFPSVCFIIRVILYDFLPFVHRIEVDLNMKNSEGLTAVDILQQEGQLDFWIILAMQAVAKRILPLGGPEYATGAADYFRRKISGFRKWAISTYSQNLLMPDGNRNAVFVVAVLIATATYQAVLSPPGGLWQADPTSVSCDRSHINSTANSANNDLFEPVPGTSILGINQSIVFGY
ncbi:hypothetical protein GH714_010588 [Hevea brasiliensis]|uniref:PGG domain-containing protein n=1 Tax=Hevea brasiliensis TaxID=3981 RepID=A0A6A6N3P6_HEVBR|nr:hypothetical protein GH714_010588 [Hevea brasiliensis]